MQVNANKVLWWWLGTKTHFVSFPDMKFSFHHVALSVTDLPRSREFYQKLGFASTMHWVSPDSSLQVERLKLGCAMLELFCFPQPVPAPASSKDLSTDLPRLGCKHFALECENLENTILELKENGFQDIPNITTGKTGVRYVFIRDPDGILVEILEEL